MSFSRRGFIAALLAGGVTAFLNSVPKELGDFSRRDDSPWGNLNEYMYENYMIWANRTSSTQPGMLVFVPKAKYLDQIPIIWEVFTDNHEADAALIAECFQSDDWFTRVDRLMRERGFELKVKDPIPCDPIPNWPN